MTFTQVTFLIFFPLTILAYFLIPSRLKYVWLLLCSITFYLAQNDSMVSYLLYVTVLSYGSGYIFSILSSNKINIKKAVLFADVFLTAGGLFAFKYAPIENIGLFMPIGISFFTFQALSYVIDCYRGDMEPEKNPLKVALFISFFPTILSGPIQRGKTLMPQFECNYSFDTIRVKDGLFAMLWGYFLKIVISGRLLILTTQVLESYEDYSGSMLLVTMLLYAFLIYCDFAGYSYIAIGAGKIMGFDLGINFRQPYLSGSIGEFWRRWHISLSGWFRDYLYIPLGGSKKGTLRKYLNALIVFAVSGIWHGDTVNFLIWGLLNGFYQVMGQILTPVKTYLIGKCRLENKLKIRRALAIAGSFILLDIAWVFFAVPSFKDAVSILSKIILQFNAVDLFNGKVFLLGLGMKNLLIVILALGILIISDVLCEVNKCDITGLLPKFKTGMRWLIYYGLIIAILMSVNLSTTEFIYSKF